LTAKIFVTPASSSHRHDGYGGSGRYAPSSLALGAGAEMLKPLAIAVTGGILISMVLSLIITPAIQYCMAPDKEAMVDANAPVAVQ
jgi:hypothetical protein